MVTKYRVRSCYKLYRTRLRPSVAPGTELDQLHPQPRSRITQFIQQGDGPTVFYGRI